MADRDLPDLFRIRLIKYGETPIFAINNSFIHYLSDSSVFTGLITTQSEKKDPADQMPGLHFWKTIKT